MAFNIIYQAVQIALTILEIDGKFLIVLQIVSLLVSIMDLYKKRPPKHPSSTSLITEPVASLYEFRNPATTPSVVYSPGDLQ